MIAIGNFGSKLLVYFLIRFYTAYLTPEMYSTADLITQTAKLIMPLISLSMAESVFRFALDKELDKRQVFSAGLYTLGISSLALVPVYIILALSGFFDGYSYLIILYVLAANIHALFSMYIRTKDHFKFFAIQGLVNTFTMVALNIVFLAVFKMGVEGYVLSGIIADLFTSVIIFIKEKLWLDMVRPARIAKGITKNMLKYGVPLIPTSVLWWVTNVSDRYVVKIFSGDTENGLYSVAYKIPSLLVLLCTIFLQAWNFSSVSEEDDNERRSFFKTVFSAYSALQFFAGSGIILFLNILVRILFDPSYYDAGVFIPTLVVATVFSGLVTFLGSVYTVNKKSMNLFYTSLVAAAMNFILNFILVPESLFGIKMPGLGAMGAAIATFISYFAVFIMRVKMIKRDFPFDMKLPLVAINTLLLSLQCVISTIGIKGGIIYQIVIFLFIAVINLKSLSSVIKKLLPAKFLKK